MNSRLTLALLAILAVLGGYVFFVEKDKAPPTPTPFPGAAPVTTPIALTTGLSEDIQAINIRTPEGRAVLTRPPGGNWLVTAPVVGEADQIRVATSAGRLAPLTASREISATGKLSDFGLDPIQTSLTITRKDATTDEINIGDSTPDGQNYYVRKGNSGSLYLVSKLTIDDIKKFVTDPPLPKPTPTAAPPPTSVLPAPTPAGPVATPTPAS